MHESARNVGYAPDDRSPRLIDAVRARLRMRHYSLRTEQVYVGWILRFIRFHGRRHPREMGAPEVEAFLSSLAVEGRVAASTQNQALSALQTRPGRTPSSRQAGTQTSDQRIRLARMCWAGGTARIRSPPGSDNTASRRSRPRCINTTAAAQAPLHWQLFAPGEPHHEAARVHLDPVAAGLGGGRPVLVVVGPAEPVAPEPQRPHRRRAGRHRCR